MNGTLPGRTLACVLAAALMLALLAGCARGADPQAKAWPQASPVEYRVADVTDPTVCATAAVYVGVVADDWSQRAAAAQAALNRFERLGGVPDCGTAVSRILARGVDQYRWNASLDAVRAVQTNSYVLPLACVRADTVIPTVDGDGLPAASPEAARTQCVIGSLAFVEGR